MIISEVNAVFDLVVKATSFCTQFQDGWYKGSAELAAFQDKVLILSAKHSQWSEQLQRYGFLQDKHLLLVVKLAKEALQKQRESAQKLQRSPFSRLRKRVFPGQLSYLLDKVLEIVDAGPQLLATKVANNDLLERYTVQTPTLLPFGRDRNYVQIVDTILEVQNALENADGPRVVTIYGGPGMGKSSLVKYLAIDYQEEKKRGEIDASLEKSCVFPDGVYYLFCGRQAESRVKQLQLALLQSLGFSTSTDSSSTGGVQEGDYVALPSHQTKLRSRLAEQKLLIILDDLWQATVLQELLVPAKGVKYLVTSQMKDIYGTAKKIQIRRPTHEEASHIMANYTDGLPKKGEFPASIQILARDIIEKVECHPLALANIGISINSTRATETSQWQIIRDNLYVHLDEHDFQRPPAYDMPYNLPVSASMTLMVESLPSEARQLLFLMALFGGQSLPEPLVKFFYKFIETKNFGVRYNSDETFLQNKSLIELRVERNRSYLDSHSLRSHYIREKNTLAMRSLGSQILVASGIEDVAKPIENGDREETLISVLGAVYYHQSFKDVIASTLENHIQVINAGVIPRSLNMEADTLDLVESARKQDHQINRSQLVWLLNADEGEEGWKPQAHEYAKKILIKFICQGKLDDDSMASLLKHPQTTLTACSALNALCRCHWQEYYYQNVTFSSAYSGIMRTLLALFHDNGISVKRLEAVMDSLFYVLDYERENTILELAARCRAFLAMDFDPTFQLIMFRCFYDESCYSDTGIYIVAEFPGLLEDLIELLLFGKDHKVRMSAARSIYSFCQSRRANLRIAAVPNALQVLFDLFISEDGVADGLEDIAGKILSCESSVQENRMKFREIRGMWEGLRDILTKLEEEWRATREGLNCKRLERRASVAASILGYLGLEKDLRDTIASLPGVGEGLLFLERLEMARYWNYPSRHHTNVSYYSATRALTVLYCNPADPESTNLPSLEAVLEIIAKFDEGLKSEAMTMVPSVPDMVYLGIYWTRVLAYIHMGSYVESLKNLDLAQRHLDLIPKLGQQDPFCQITSPAHTTGRIWWPATSALRKCRVFLQAMQEDYAGALLFADGLTETGVLKWLSGDLQGAFEDLNAAAAMKPVYEGSWDLDGLSSYSSAFKHLGYVKHLMNDKTGARKDAEFAQQLELNRPNRFGIIYSEGEDLWDIRKIPLCYLGFSL